MRTGGHSERKRRTREHVIAELSYNFVERKVLECGWAAEPIRRDYGLDAMVFTYGKGGEVEPGVIWLQLKASDRPRYGREGRWVAVRVPMADVLAWRRQPMPVILIVYDAGRDRAHWLHVQSSLPPRTGRGKSVVVRVPIENAWDADGVKSVAGIKEAVRRESRARISREE